MMLAPNAVMPSPGRTSLAKPSHSVGSSSIAFAEYPAMKRIMTLTSCVHEMPILAAMSGLLRTLIVGGFLIGVGMLVAVAIPSLNPFATRTVDRSPPAVLRSISKLSEYRAATAHLQQVVDIEQDAKYLPSFLKGSKSLLVAAGRVDAVVDFSALRAGAIAVSDDRRSAVIPLPAPRLSKPQLDLEHSRVYDRDRGLVDRVEGVFEDNPTEDRSLYIEAEHKMAGAAAADGGVL